MNISTLRLILSSLEGCQTGKLLKIIFLLFVLLSAESNSFLLFGMTKVSERLAEEKFSPSDAPYEPKSIESLFKLPSKYMASSTKVKGKKSIEKIAEERVKLIKKAFKNLAPKAKENINHIVNDFSKISIILLCWKSHKNPEGYLQEIYNLNEKESENLVKKFATKLQEQIKMIKLVPEEVKIIVEMLKKMNINTLGGMAGFKTRIRLLINKINKLAVAEQQKVVLQLVRQTMKNSNEITSIFAITLFAGNFLETKKLFKLFKDALVKNLKNEEEEIK